MQTTYTKPLSEKWGSYQRAVVKIMEEQSVCAFSEKNKIRGWSEKPEICLERHYWLLQPVTNTDMPELSHTPQQGAAAYLVLQSSFPFSTEVPANTPVCTASPHWSASKTAPLGRDIHLETLLQYKASGLFLPNYACFSEAGMPHNPCSWCGSEKAVHIAMAHTKFPSSGIPWHLPENPSNRTVLFVQVH